MAEHTPAVRLTESLPGRLAGILLAVLWIFSMAAVDAHAFSAFPACIALAVVLVVVVTAVLAGKRLVRMSNTGWCALAVGGYFLVRSMNSYAVVDSWGETALILGGMVYYVAGVYVAQNKNYGAVAAWLAFALLANVLAMWAARQPWFGTELLGRAAYTPEGRNALPMALFIYKNFAGVFLCLGGCVLCAWSLWGGCGWRRLGGLLVGAVAVVAAFMCLTRAVYLVFPLAVLLLWGLKLLFRLFEGRKMSVLNIVAGCVFLVSFLVALFDLLFGNHLMGLIGGIDTHLRFYIWLAVCEVLPSVPLWGCGANATTWELIPFYSEWQLPNYAHNEYLQVWVDYGVLGLLFSVVLVGGHLLRGLRCLASESVPEARKHLVIVCMTVVAVVAGYSFVDFPMHSFAFVSLMAFACGALASPFAHREQSWFSGRTWASPGQVPLVPVRAQGWPGRGVLLLLAVGLGGVAVTLGCKLQPAWQAQWAYNEVSRGGGDGRAELRREMIAALLPHYPSPALLDTYFMFPQNQVEPAEQERLLKLALAANPKQLFTATMLVGVLGNQGKYAEAEQLMRDKYPGDGLTWSLLNNWPAYYSLNLIFWGRHEMQQGRRGRALSMLDYGLKIHGWQRISFKPVWRVGPQPWKETGGIRPGLYKLIEAARTDLHLLRLTGVQPDDSWQQPLTPGGRPSLYRAVVQKKGS